jgi:hypothetical protein
MRGFSHRATLPDVRVHVGKVGATPRGRRCALPSTRPTKRPAGRRADLSQAVADTNVPTVVI